MTDFPQTEIECARYENTNNIGIAIVASITHYQGKICDWAAYIGATTDAENRLAAIDATEKWGNKLILRDAQHYFPDLPKERYRE